MHIRIVFLLVAMVSMPASAQQVFKCVKGKEVSYQTDPCQGGQAAKTWDAQPQAVDPYAQQRTAAIQAEMDARNRAARAGSYGQAAARPQGAQVAQQRNPNACEAARRGRDAAFAAAGNRRSFKLSSYWDNAVQDACK